MIELILAYLGLFALAIVAIACIRTNFATEVKSLFKTGGKVVWFFSNNRKPKEIIPDKVDSKGIYLKNTGKRVMEFYPLNYASWMPCGPIQKAIVFEGISYPIDLRYMALAAQAKKMGFPDYTQFEVACCLRKLENDLGETIDAGFIQKPQKLSQDGENWREYKRGLDWIKEQIVQMTGDPWTFSATDSEVKRALDNGCYMNDKNEEKAFILLEDFRNWINRNASTHDIEDIITSVRVEEREDAMFGKGLIPNIPAMSIVLILIGLAIAYVIFNSGGGIDALIPKASQIIPTTTRPPIGM